MITNEFSKQAFELELEFWKIPLMPHNNSMFSYTNESSFYDGPYTTDDNGANFIITQKPESRG